LEVVFPPKKGVVLLRRWYQSLFQERWVSLQKIGGIYLAKKFVVNWITDGFFLLEMGEY
jgi:hypothetical protein